MVPSPGTIIFYSCFSIRHLSWVWSFPTTQCTLLLSLPDSNHELHMISLTLPFHISATSWRNTIIRCRKCSLSFQKCLCGYRVVTLKQKAPGSLPSCLLTSTEGGVVRTYRWVLAVILGCKEFSGNDFHCYIHFILVYLLKAWLSRSCKTSPQLFSPVEIGLSFSLWF